MQHIPANEFILKIVEKYFDSADAIMISGSQADNEYIDKSKDIDLLIIKNFGIFGGYQNLNLEGISIDVTIVSPVNLDVLLIKETDKDPLSALLHGISNGRIIYDKFGQLAHHKEFADFLYSNKKDFTIHPDINSAFSVKVLQKLYSDYQSQVHDSLLSFMVLSQLISRIIDLELTERLGGTMPGSNKIKTRIFETLEPETSKDLHFLINNSKTAEGKEILEKHINETYLKKYHELIINDKSPSLKYNYFWNDKIALKTNSKQKITGIIQLLTEYVKNRKCHIYFQYSQYIRDKESPHLLIIKGDYKFLSKVIVPILNNERTNNLLIRAANFPLLERYNGGPDVLSASESFYSYLSESILSIGGRNRCKKLSSIDKNNLAIIIMQMYSQIFELESKDLTAFFTYIFDYWFPYSYTRGDQSLEENQNFSKIRLNKFETLYESQKEVLEYIFNEVNVCLKGLSKHSYLISLLKQLKMMNNKSRSSVRYVPEFDCKMIMAYSDVKDSELWYIYRRQLESIFSVLDIDNSNWGYLAFLTKNLSILNTTTKSF